MTSLFQQYHHLWLTSCVPVCFIEWKLKHLQLAASTTDPALTSVTSKPFKGKCVSWRAKGGGGGNQRICLGLRHGLVWERGGACLGERGDCDESGNHGDPHEPSFWGVNIQQPRLPDVNSSTVTELLCNSNYEWANEYDTRLREENRLCPDGRVCASVPRFPSPCRIFHHCKQLIEVKMSGLEHCPVSVFQV